MAQTNIFSDVFGPPESNGTNFIELRQFVHELERKQIYINACKHAVGCNFNFERNFTKFILHNINVILKVKFVNQQHRSIKTGVEMVPNIKTKFCNFLKNIYIS